MADLKISQLTGATTPLAGTEVLPIVQSGSTKKVTVADLTAGRAVATAGGTFTDNFTQGVAAKGIDFSANTPLAGKSSTLLNWYEEGYYVAAMTADTGTVTLSYNRLNYTRAGRMVTVSGEIVVSALSSPVPTGELYIDLPFAAAASSQRSGRTTLALGLAYTFTGAPTGQLFAYFDQNDTKMALRTLTNFTQSQFAQYLAVGTAFDLGFTYQCQ